MKSKKIMAPKKADTNTIIQDQPIKYDWFDYQCIFTGLMKPMSENGINRIADEVVDWARNDVDAYKLSQFYLHKGISSKTWENWCKKYERLQDASDAAKQLIGNRREIGAIKHELNYGPIGYTMPFYDPDWKAETERRASLKEGNAESRSSITVNMNAIPNSPLVPDKNSND